MYLNYFFFCKKKKLCRIIFNAIFFMFREEMSMPFSKYKPNNEYTLMILYKPLVEGRSGWAVSLVVSWAVVEVYCCCGYSECTTDVKFLCWCLVLRVEVDLTRFFSQFLLSLGFRFVLFCSFWRESVSCVSQSFLLLLLLLEVLACC
jgi:hypothetical protein